MSKSGDSDEEFGPVMPDKLDGPIDQSRSLSKYGSFVKKPVIVNPRADSDDEYDGVRSIEADVSVS